MAQDVTADSAVLLIPFADTRAEATIPLKIGDTITACWMCKAR